MVAEPVNSDSLVLRTDARRVMQKRRKYQETVLTVNYWLFIVQIDNDYVMKDMK